MKCGTFTAHAKIIITVKVFFFSNLHLYSAGASCSSSTQTAPQKTAGEEWQNRGGRDHACVTLTIMKKKKKKLLAQVSNSLVRTDPLKAEVSLTKQNLLWRPPPTPVLSSQGGDRQQGWGQRQSIYQIVFILAPWSHAAVSAPTSLPELPTFFSILALKPDFFGQQNMSTLKKRKRRTMLWGGVMSESGKSCFYVCGFSF